VELTTATTQIAGRSRAHLFLLCALLHQKAGPEGGAFLNISWAFFNFARSHSDSIFPTGEGSDCRPSLRIPTFIRQRRRPSFIVFVIFVLNAPYFLLGIASQRNLRYNVPNR
jgi:hypothetical protein